MKSASGNRGPRRAAIVVLALAGAAIATAGAAHAEGDAAKGKKVVRKCAACHSLEPGKKKLGPHLSGLINRKSGTVAGFKYSKAMRTADIVWDEETLDTYLVKPRQFLKGTRMAFPGLKKAQDRADLIAYLKTVEN